MEETNIIILVSVAVVGLIAFLMYSGRNNSSKLKVDNFGSVETENKPADVKSNNTDIYNSNGSVMQNSSIDNSQTTHISKEDLNSYSLEDIMKHTIEKLDMCGKKIKSKNLIDEIIKKHCNQLKDYLQNYSETKIVISTQELYESIDEVFESYEKIKIIDHDIHRWDELVVGHENFYFSKKIIKYSIDQSAENSAFCLERIFILTKNDLKSGEMHNIIQILKRIEELSKNGDDDKIRIYIYEVGKNGVIDNKLKMFNDFVLAKKGNDTIVLSEDFNYKNRKPSNETKSYLSTEDKNNELSNFFQKMLDSKHLVDYKKYIKEYENKL